MIYLDNNATTALAPEVKSAMLPFLDGEYGNPSSHNALGKRAREAVIAARQSIAQHLAAAPAEVVFTSGATESNHVAILGALDYFRGKRRHIVSTAVEHPSTLKLLEALAERGVKITLIGVDENGQLDLAAMKAAIDDDTALVSAMWVNNETGVIFPVEKIAELAKNRGALFHTDAVQGAFRLPSCWENGDIDLLSFSAHKLHAPKGIGVLLQRKGVDLPPLFYGSQERHRRGGTENVMGIAALGVAATLSYPTQEIAALRDLLESRITALLPFSRVNGSRADRICNTSSITFGVMNGEELLQKLERAGVVAALGSACQSGGNQPSHVLTAMKMNETNARSTLRFSLSRYSKIDELEQACAIITAAACEISRAI